MTETELSPAEYARWLTPHQAINALCPPLDYSTARYELFIRLKNGLVQTAAELCVIRRHGSERERYARNKMAAGVWEKRDSPPDHQFWDAGSIVLRNREYQNDHELSYFGVRFDPDQIAVLVAAQTNTLSQITAAKSAIVAGNSAGEAIAPSPPKRDLPKGEAENFARAILAGWPTSTEEFALAKARLFFPEHKVPKDWFLGIFRLIRGPRNRGKQPKNRD